MSTSRLRRAVPVAVALVLLAVSSPAAQAKLITFTHYTLTVAAASPVPYGQPVALSGTVTPSGTAIALAVQEQQPDTSWITVGSAPLTPAGTYHASEACAVGQHVLRVVRYPHAPDDLTSYSPSITVTCQAFSALGVSPATLPDGHQWKPYYETLAAAGGVAPYTWSATGLPGGLGLTATTGVLSGTPSAAGTSGVAVTVADSAAHTATVTLPLTVEATTAGTLYAWGRNDFGQLGDGNTVERHKPVKVVGLKAVTQVAGDAQGAIALTPSGSVESWGINGLGELGIGSTSIPLQHNTPVQVPSLSGVVAVASGAEARYALKKDGTVWAWGNNEYSNLGLGPNGPASADVPTRVPGLTGVTAIAAGFETVYALRSDGTVWGFGWNASGQLGSAHTTGPYDGVPTPVRLPYPPDVKAIAVGFAVGYALVDGRVWAMGDGEFGDLGNGQLQDSAVPVRVQGLPAAATGITAAGYSGFARLTDGTLWGWGANDTGQLGIATMTDHEPAVRVHNLNVVTSAAGSGEPNGYALRYGRLWAWGSDDSGQLGNGSTNYSLTPIVVAGLSGVVFATGAYDPGYLGTTYAIAN